MFEVQSQQPGNFSLHVQDRVRGVQLVLQASHLRLERAHLRIQRVAFGRFRAALLRGQLPQRALAPRCVQRSASSRIRSRYPAVNWRRFGLAATSGSGAGLAPLARALGVSSLRSSTPRARASTSFNVIDSLSVTIGSHLHRPTVIPRGAGVSSMLAERAPKRIGSVVEADARRIGEVFPRLKGRITDIITSPPYLDTTNYREDQWLRLWFLGCRALTTYDRGDDRHYRPRKV